MEHRQGRDPLTVGRSAPFALDLRRARLLSGLVLAAFLVWHFLNHALGLVSLGAMEDARLVFVAVWHSWPATILLYGAVLFHLATALVALYRLRTLRMPWREALQTGLGFALPVLILPHVVGTRVLSAVTGRDARYVDVVSFLWSADPVAGIQQIVALLVAWLHVCLGLWFWLRSKPAYPVYAPLLLTAAILVPLLACLGFASAGKEIEAGPTMPPVVLPAAAAHTLDQVGGALRLGLGAALAATLLAWAVRTIADRARRITIRYPGGRTVPVPAGFSVLEASRLHGVPHLSVCGARGRCSTCRVRVVHSEAALPLPAETELATLHRIGAGPEVRLACQLRPRGSLDVVPLLAPGEALAPARAGDRDAAGEEREVAALFCDLRGFTQLTDRRLPFDTVYLLNRYFAAVGAAVEREGGHLDKFIGDGALALFGLNGPPDLACRQALAAVSAIVEAVDALSVHVRDEVGADLRLAMGLHVGGAVVGRMGYGRASGLTAIGDTINVASRLEGLAKEADALLAVSAVTAERAGLEPPAGEVRTAAIRGRAEPLRVWVVAEVGAFRSALAGSGADRSR